MDAREQRRQQRAQERRNRVLVREQRRQTRSASSGSPGPRRALRGKRDEPELKALPIALRRIDGHITRTTSQVMAWYRLAPQHWSFRADVTRTLLIQQIASQMGELAGRWLHVRVTSRPYSVATWAQAFDANSPGHLPDRPGGLSWADFLRGEQLHLAGQAMSDKQVFIGVEVSGRNSFDRWADFAEPVLKRLLPSSQDSELLALDTEINHVSAIMGAPGLDAVPASPDDMAWLMRRSVGLGLPPSQRPPAAVTGRWETEDLAAFTDHAAMVSEPYDPTLQVIGAVDGVRTERRLAVLTLGQVGELHIPEATDPWMHRADMLPFPVEWSARIRMRTAQDVGGELQRQMGKVRSQESHYVDDHGQDPPLALQRQADQVREIEDELSTGLHGMHTRLYGWWRIAVTGETEQQVIDRARAVVDAYKPQIAIEHPEGQYKLAREFIPGEPLASTAYRRRGSAAWAAAAVPAATASAGDTHGILLGETCGSARHPVSWEPWSSQEIRQGSGLTAIIGGLGSGKSFLTGLTVYKTLRAGARWTVLDPSGPLAELTKLPELAPFSRHIHLLGADPGILNPYRVVAEPRIEHFADEPEPEKAFKREKANAQGDRRRLVQDVLTGLLPQKQAALANTEHVLLAAVRKVGAEPWHHPGEVIDELRVLAGHPESDPESARHAARIADFLDERRELPQAALLFPDPERPVDPWDGAEDIRLTVLTMQGLTLPQPGSPREAWTDAEALGVTLLNLASWLTQRTIYDADRNLRKGVALDEAHFLSQTPAGRVLIDRLARDSRKFNVRALFASQLAGDLLRVSGFASLVDAVFVGRTDDAEAQAEALRLLRIPTDVGYESVLSTLSPRPRHDDRPDATPRQFIFADGHGGTEKIRIDLEGEHLDALREALDTNPNAHRVRAPQDRPALLSPSADSEPREAAEAAPSELAEPAAGTAAMGERDELVEAGEAPAVVDDEDTGPIPIVLAAPPSGSTSTSTSAKAPDADEERGPDPVAARAPQADLA